MKKHELQLFNTLTRHKDIFVPLKKIVSLYNCGPTVYHDQHIGNFRTAMSVDLLKRTLLLFGYAVKHITNITDVGHLTNDAEDTGEDKIAVGARRENLTATQVARKYEKLYKADLKSLNNLSPIKWTRATEHIKEQIALIKNLERRGFIYTTADGIYFDSTRCADYGKLVGLQSMKLQPGKRIDVGEKKNPHDFALWKFAAEGVDRQMKWKSPWGIGFPGWHIECSAMAIKYLGETIDIHAGGIDLIPVHHTNEIAQAECATGKQFVRFWIHGAFVIEGEEKMSKSKGNVKTMDWIRDNGFSPLDYRYLTLQTHYRKELMVTLESLSAARIAFAHLKNFIINSPSRGGKIIQKSLNDFFDALGDDINAPRALALVWDVIKSDAPPADKRKTILEFDKVLGLGLAQLKKQKIPDLVQKLIAERKNARDEKNWELSDSLRTKIYAQGFDVLDTPNGQTVQPVL